MSGRSTNLLEKIARTINADLNGGAVLDLLKKFGARRVPIAKTYSIGRTARAINADLSGGAVLDLLKKSGARRVPIATELKK